jgi:hypothetical protein
MRRIYRLRGGPQNGIFALVEGHYQDTVKTQDAAQALAQSTRFLYPDDRMVSSMDIRHHDQPILSIHSFSGQRTSLMFHWLLLHSKSFSSKAIEVLASLSSSGS